MIWLRTHLYAILLGAKAVLLALAYTKGRKDAKAARDTQDMRDGHDTRKRIDQIARDGDVDAQREWLFQRGRK
jgi:hypothetical protein